mmetsp:Transcript_103594/g.322827  ORF Transcript_103594/g.322827 Transcript_103594/m.322827 type:complete len:253 (+) Transcript_103594:10-768(+)
MEVDDGPEWRCSAPSGYGGPPQTPAPLGVRAADELVALSALEGDEAVLAVLAGGHGGLPATGAAAALRAELALCLAAGRGDAAAVASLLQAGCEVNCAPSFGGMTPLMFASRSGQLQALELLLLQPGVMLNGTTSTGHTALSLCRDDSTRLLVAHAMLARSGDGGRGAVLQAACLGHAGSLRSLLAAAADPNMADDRGRSALLVAALRRQLEACEVLLAHGAEPGPAGAPGSVWVHADERLRTVLLLHRPPR